VQYWVHRACHRVPFLWRFHAVHHSAEAMDWLAGSRLHLVDALLTRALVFAAIAALGFDLRAVAAYLVFVGAQATFVHCNTALRLSWLEPFLVTPRFHHWHHARELQDVNFAVHLPWLDRLFGTWSMPSGWPQGYGLAGGAKGWRGFWRQMVGPFVGGPRAQP
jgi:lathosterol oxidase